MANCLRGGIYKSNNNKKKQTTAAVRGAFIGVSSQRNMYNQCLASAHARGRELP